MKYLFLFIFVLGIVGFAYADGRVCIEKSTGKLIEYQSGNALLGTLTTNAVNLGYKAEDIEEKYITGSEWESIKENQIIKPLNEKIIQKENERKQKEESIKKKLNLTDRDFQDLKEALE